MKFTAIGISLAALFSVASADKVRYNTFYDNPGTSLNNVACSNGPNGLITKGYPTFGSLPSFPGIGGVSIVGGWNSPFCGSCWKLTYEGKSIYVTAVDTIYEGFSISLKAMDNLTKGRARELDVVDAKISQVNRDFCGLT